MSAPRRVILVTGAASGIGRATAQLFARRGWIVGLLDRDAGGLTTLSAETGAAHVLPADVTDADAVAAAVARLAEATGGRLDALFNAAGILRMGAHADLSLAEQHATVAVNLSGVLNAIHAAWPALVATPGSRVISMSSASALYGQPELAVYSATKFAVRGLTEGLNIEALPHDVWVCDVMAPYVRTPMTTGQGPQAASLRRMGARMAPEAVARVVWRAAHRRRLHWRVGLQMHAMAFLRWATPWATRPVTRWLARP